MLVKEIGKKIKRTEHKFLAKVPPEKKNWEINKSKTSTMTRTMTRKMTIITTATTTITTKTK